MNAFNTIPVWHLVSLKKSGAIRLVTICVINVAYAAPFIPNTGIQTIFKITLMTAPIPRIYFTYLFFFSANIQIPLAVPITANSSYQMHILNVSAAFINALPYKICIIKLEKIHMNIENIIHIEIWKTQKEISSP